MMTAITPKTPYGAYVESGDPEFPFRNNGAPKRFSSPMKTESGLASKEKMNTESSSDPEFDEVEEEYPTKQRDEDEEEYTIFTKVNANPSKIKKNRGPIANPKANKAVGNAQNKKKKVCEFCGASDTPMWRRGPQGKGTLCNACGVKWSLKFRKKNGTKRDANGEAVGDKTKSTRKSARKDKPGPGRKPKMLMQMPASPPHYMSSYLPDDVYQEDQCEYYCKSCGNNWPSRYFRGSQPTGQCSNCSRKQMIMIRSDSPHEKLEDEECLYHEGAKRRRALEPEYSPDYPFRASLMESDEANDDSQSDLDVDIRGNRLFGSLLNVVENKLVEVQELEALKKEFEDWKGVLALKEEQRQKLTEETQLKLSNELAIFRQQVLSMVSANEQGVNAKLERVEAEVEQVRRTTDTIKQDLQDLKSTVPKSSDPAFATKIEGLETQMSLIQKLIEANSLEFKNYFANDMLQTKTNLLSDLEASELRVSSNLASLKKQSQEELEHVKQQMDRMEFIFEKSEERSTP